MKNYQYPLAPDWQKDEIILIMALLQGVEQVYEGGADRADLLATYQAAKTVIPSKADEKQLDKAFQAESGYSLYQALKLARESSQATISIKGAG